MHVVHEFGCVFWLMRYLLTCSVFFLPTCVCLTLCVCISFERGRFLSLGVFCRVSIHVGAAFDVVETLRVLPPLLSRAVLPFRSVCLSHDSYPLVDRHRELVGAILANGKMRVVDTGAST